MKKVILNGLGVVLTLCIVILIYSYRKDGCTGVGVLLNQCGSQAEMAEWMLDSLFQGAVLTGILTFSVMMSATLLKK